jgi:hypothetical protein
MMAQSHRNDDEIHSTIRAHVQAFWPDSTMTEEAPVSGAIERNVPGFRVLRLRPHARGMPAVYLTCGCFASENEHIRHEFFITSPWEAREHVETLTMLANYHADAHFRLKVGSIVGIGDPWMANSNCDHLLISLPYPYGPKLEWLPLEEACLRFLWALPITPEEAAFARLKGVEALEQRFDGAELDYLNPYRDPVV